MHCTRSGSGARRLGAPLAARTPLPASHCPSPKGSHIGMPSSLPHSPLVGSADTPETQSLPRRRLTRRLESQSEGSPRSSRPARLAPRRGTATHQIPGGRGCVACSAHCPALRGGLRWRRRGLRRRHTVGRRRAARQRVPWMPDGGCPGYHLTLTEPEILSFSGGAVSGCQVISLSWRVKYYLTPWES